VVRPAVPFCLLCPFWLLAWLTSPPRLAPFWPILPFCGAAPLSAGSLTLAPSHVSDIC